MALETESGPGRVLGEEYPGREIGAHSRLRCNRVNRRGPERGQMPAHIEAIRKGDVSK